MQIHTNLLFSSTYADTVETITGSRDILDRHSKNAGARFLKLKHLGELEFKNIRRHNDGKDDLPDNRIGVRRHRLRRLNEIERLEKKKTDGTDAAADASKPDAETKETVDSAASSAAAPSGMGLGMINIPGLNLSDPAAPAAAADATAPPPTSTINFPSLAGMVTDGSSQRKNLNDLLAEYKTKAKPKEDPVAAAKAAADAAAKTDPKKKTNGTVGGRGPSGKVGDSGKPLSGLAALRARFEKT